uniref:Serpentine Receptor, class T n=1 Tax=Strongyloides venezuelensis TaxID=75913 RepID=A0A0K0FPH4_STRVS
MVRIFLTSESYNYYFNCSFYSNERWWEEGKPNHFIGIFYLVLGFIFEILYIPSLIAMVNSELIYLSCYKIMFFIGLLDFFVIIINAIFSGYLGYIGAVACNYPLLNYVLGVLALIGWITASTSCLLLAINRVIDMFNSHLSLLLFDGYKTFLWLLIPIIYGLAAGIFSNPPGFTSKQMAWFYDPHYGTYVPQSFKAPNYINYVQVVHNLLVTSVMSIVYTVFCGLIGLKYKTTHKIRLTDPKGSLFIQSFIICFSSFVAAAVNVYMQFFPTPNFVVIIGHFLWIFTHGFTSVILIVFNKTIRGEIKTFYFHMIGKNRATRVSIIKSNSIRH